MKELVISVIDEDRDRVICRFEAAMFAKYKEAVEPYVPLFNEIGCALKLELGWRNSNRNTWSTNRLPIENGYECYVYCIVERDGEEIHIKSNDGEADYYPLTASWMISYVCRRFHKLKISLCASIDEVDIELTDFLSQLKHI